MKILIDLQHPAHLHFFRNAVARFQKEGHEVRITGRDKDILIELADEYGWKVDFFGVARNGLFNLGRELIYRQGRLLRIARTFKPDVIMAVAGTFVSLVGRLTGTPTYVFYDTEHATASNLLAYPFATRVFVPTCYSRKIRRQHTRYDGYQELAYLHPRYFVPDPGVLQEVGLESGEIFTLVRFVGWNAGHDLKKNGMSLENKCRAIKELKRYGRVLISAEGNIPPELEELRFPLNVARIHHLMAYAALVFGDSGTMTAEGAALGVPGLFVSPLRLGYLDEQENKYGLVFNFKPERIDRAIDKATTILENYDREQWKGRGRRLMEDKIDVTQLIYETAMKRRV